MQRQMQDLAWPTAWLMTDERIGDALDHAIARAAAARAGIIVRHHLHSRKDRRRIAELVRSHGAILGISRDVALAEETAAALVHNPASPTGGLPFSLSVHDEAEALAARPSAAALVFVSPVYATRSHPDAPVLGEDRARDLARITGKPAIALGGVTPERGKRLVELGWAGWAGIDGWLRT